MKIKKVFLPLALATTVFTAGCATIVGSPTQTLNLKSSPDGAAIVVTDEKGVEVFKGVTPTTVTLNKSDGSYFGKKSFTVNVTKPGFKTQSIPLKASANGWYMFGNLIFGGLIGYLIVDPLNGDMYTLSPKDVSATMGEETALNTYTSDGFQIVLLEDVPNELRGQMKHIGS